MLAGMEQEVDVETRTVRVAAFELDRSDLGRRDQARTQDTPDGDAAARNLVSAWQPQGGAEAEQRKCAAKDRRPVHAGSKEIRDHEQKGGSRRPHQNPRETNAETARLLSVPEV